MSIKFINVYGHDKANRYIKSTVSLSNVVSVDKIDYNISKAKNNLVEYCIHFIDGRIIKLNEEEYNRIMVNWFDRL
jgi:hypothetical protein